MNAKAAKFPGPQSLKQRRILYGIILGVIAIHAAALLILGSIVVFRHIFKREVTFETPPEIVKKIDPRKLEHKVKVQKQQQKSGRPRIQPRLSSAKVSDFTLPEIKSLAMPKLDPLKSSLPSFAAAGVGTGVAGGMGTGGLGTGVSQVRFMGFNANTERVAVILDLSPSMVEDQRGGFDGYDALKDEVKELVMSLNPGSLFNLIAFSTHVDIFKPEAVRASDENKKEAVRWIEPYMTDRVDVKKNGPLLRNYKPRADTPMMDATGGKTRFDLAFASAFESGVDTIFIVTDGVHFITKRETDEEREARLDREKKVPPQELRRREQLLKEREEENKRRARRGLPPKVVELEGFGGPPLFGDEEVRLYLRETAKKLYTEQGLPMPRVYVIGYVTTPKDEAFLKNLAQDFKGRFRRSRALVKPIRF